MLFYYGRMAFSQSNTRTGYTAIKRQFDSADFVIEGRVVSERYYFPDSESNQQNFRYHIKEYKIQKVYKGDLRCGTIEVLTRQHGYGDSSFFIIYPNSYSDGSDLLIGDGVLFLKKDLRNYSSSSKVPITATTPFRVRADYGFTYTRTSPMKIIEKGIKGTKKNYTKFNSITDFYQFVGKFKGMTNPIVCLDTSKSDKQSPQLKKDPYREHFDSAQKRMKIMNEEKFYERIKESPVKPQGQHKANTLVIRSL